MGVGEAYLDAHFVKFSLNLVLTVNMNNMNVIWFINYFNFMFFFFFKITFLGLICGTMCLIGILFVLGSGSYWVALFDAFAGSFPLITVALSECLAIGYVYGANKYVIK